MTGILWLSATDQSLSAVSKTSEAKFPVLAKHFHVTLQFGVKWESIHQDVKCLVGKSFVVQPLSNCYNDRIQALSVRLPEEISGLCFNKHPHLTISMESGVKPSESNLMLDGDHVTEVIIHSMIPNHINTVLQFHQFT